MDVVDLPDRSPIPAQQSPGQCGSGAAGHGASAESRWRATATTANFPSAVRETEEVVPVDQSTWVLPAGTAVGR